MITLIKFGTSGWRAKIGENYNVYNLRRVACATAMHIKENKRYGFNGEDYEFYLKSNNKTKPNIPTVVVGYDTRFFSEYAARIVSEVFAYHGINVIFSDIEAPTPTIAWLVMKYSAIGGVTITASHNPPEYNGYKWTPFWGGPATVEITNDLEARCFSLSETMAERYMNFDTAVSNKIIKVFDFHKDYFEQINKLIDFKRIKSANLKIAVDSVYGTARSYLRKLLENNGINVISIRDTRDVYFGGHSPDTDEENLSELKNIVVKNRCNIGVACDGDADRFGIICSNGKWLSPNIVLALGYYHMLENKKMSGGVVRSVMTSHFVDAIAKDYGCEVRETPVGFKYIGDLLRTGNYLIGGEESGGLSVRGHVPEKDGILADLLITEMIAYEKTDLVSIISKLEKKYGKYYSSRINFKISEDMDMGRIIEKLKKTPPLKLGSMPVWRIDDTDGFKFIIKNGSWLGLRPSGTEPVVRIYAESSSLSLLNQLIEEGKKIIRMDD
ncbi:MAG: phosphoglucomutase/phosphomannomutase family protein [Elusimicrobia bacterium]|nr:phosphoglucomutase/phosphomannomutase family protein [Elusimicrobiota bacterium]